MSRYLKIFYEYYTFNLKKLIIYRSNLYGQLVNNILIPFFVGFFFWRVILQTNSLGYNFNNMITYIFISNIIFLFTQVNAEGIMEKDIKSYLYGFKKILPINYNLKNGIELFSKSLAYFTIYYLPFFIISMLFFDYNFNNGLLVLFFLLIGFILNCLFSMAIGCLAFWLTEIWGISAIRNLMFGLLSGAYFPLDILPQWIFNIFKYLPFSYIAYVPTKLLTNQKGLYSISKELFFIPLVWMLLLCILLGVLFKFGDKKYTMTGG